VELFLGIKSTDTISIFLVGLFIRPLEVIDVGCFSGISSGGVGHCMYGCKKALKGECGYGWKRVLNRINLELEV